jgi:Domain of unknown function (DUF6484)
MENGSLFERGITTSRRDPWRNCVGGHPMNAFTQVEQRTEPINMRRLDGVVIGVLVGFELAGAPLVDFPGNHQDNPILARTTAALSREDVGREVALLFESSDATKPIVVGPIIHPEEQAVQKLTMDRDGERIELKADREIVLRCGSASITLTRAGKVLIRGEYISSHSRGLNKIKGGAVHIN